MNEHRQYERETHYVMPDSMKEHNARQKQQGKREREMKSIGKCQGI